MDAVPSSGPTERQDEAGRSSAGPVSVFDGDHASQPVRDADGKERPAVQWRSHVWWFMMFWMLDLVVIFLLLMAAPAAPTAAVTESGRPVILPYGWFAMLGGASFAAVFLAFLVPISLVDESTHYKGAWWLAWLWPPVMALMVAAAVLVGGMSTVKALSLLRAFFPRLS